MMTNKRGAQFGEKNHRYGKSVSIETKKKLSFALSGRPLSEEHKKKIGLANKGKIRSPEIRAKLSKAHRGLKCINRKRGQRWSIERRLKRSKAYKGSNNPKWKGGVTSVNETIRGSLEYRLWRETVFMRDNYTCVWCGARNGNGRTVVLHADHIKPFSQYPELRFAIDNGRTLCIDCHKKTDTYGGRGLTKQFIKTL